MASPKKQKGDVSQQEAVRMFKHLSATSNALKDRLPEVQVAPQERSMAELRRAYEKNDLVLVLGAGVSLDVGLPTWNTLLQRLFMKTIEAEGPLASAFFASIFNSLFNPNPVVLGRYLQHYYESKQIAFSSIVHQSLYDEYVAQTLDKTSPVLQEIVRYCIAPGKSPSLNAIITYNFDDVLEQLLRSSVVEVPFKSIYSLGENPDFHELPIYHVHGYLPFDPENGAGSEITFGETVYHKQYNDIYSWNNIVQINKFRDNTCLFIGSSLSDPNIRRLLDIAKAQKGNMPKQHYVFKRRYPADEVKARLKKLLQENLALSSQKISATLDIEESTVFLSEVYHAYEEADGQSFGVQTIWVDEFEEIPGMLREVRRGM